MDRAEAEAVVDDRLAFLVGVGDDVSGVEQAHLFQAADRSLAPVRRPF
jgi:hypothetical protein